MIGAIGQFSDAQPLATPPWIWWLGAIGLLFVTVWRLQWKLQEGELPQIKRLFLKKTIRFTEISGAIAASELGYSTEEVERQLLKAVWLGHFETLGGYSRLRVIVPEEGERIYDRGELMAVAQACGNIEDKLPASWPDISKKEFLRTCLRLSQLKISDYDHMFRDAYIWMLIFEGCDFRRWYRRFRAGVYEN